jgi:hypothetical protein
MNLSALPTNNRRSGRGVRQFHFIILQSLSREEGAAHPLFAESRRLPPPDPPGGGGSFFTRQSG